MDIDTIVIGGGEVASCMDLELLQFQEVFTIMLKASPQLAEDLSSQWLLLPDTTRLVKPIDAGSCELSDAVWIVNLPF